MFGMKPETSVFALYTRENAGYDSEMQRTKELLKPNVYYEVESISMGQSNTTIYLANFDYGFNSVHFEFYNEDKTPTDIFNRVDCNPYMINSIFTPIDGGTE